ncbi:MAG: hypothetical protein V1774_01565 [Candidatus Eisenbacteria bacterium]
MSERSLAPAGRDLGRAIVRTLWVLFAGFCLAPLSYLVLFFVLDRHRITPGTGARPLPADWEQWRFLFGVIGMATLYISYRLRSVRLDPERVRRRLREKLGGPLQPGNPGTPPVRGISESARLSRSIQDLVGRIAADHVILWALVELPSLLGVADYLLTGESRAFFGLLALTCIGLFFNRPNPARVAAIFEFPLHLETPGRAERE